MSGDIIDRACDTEERQRKEALDIHKKINTHDPLVIDGVRCCFNCEEDISKRVELLPEAVRCLICQEQHEKQYGMNF